MEIRFKPEDGPGKEQLVAHVREMAERIARKGQRIGPGNFACAGDLPTGEEFWVNFFPEHKDQILIKLREAQEGKDPKETRYRLEEDGNITVNINERNAEIEALEAAEEFGDKVDGAFSLEHKKQLEDEFLDKEKKDSQAKRAKEDEAKELGMTVLTEAEISDLIFLLEKMEEALE